MDKIKIVRLQSGEDVICEYSEGEDGFVTLSNPFSFIIRRGEDFKSSVFLTPWLPIDVIEHNIADVFTSDILTVMIPTQTIKEYYRNMVLEYYYENGEGESSISDDVNIDGDSEFYDDYMNEVDELIEENESTVMNSKTIH